MHNSQQLYLTDAEAKAFAALPDTLKEGWKVEAETLSYADTPKNREIRFMITRFHDPKLLAVRDQFKKVKTDEEYMKLLQDFDISKVSEADLGQMMFALGPDAIGALIRGILQSSVTDQDLVMVSHFAELRHELLESLTLLS